MNVAVFCHSLVSDWNHGNAHFLRGIVRELLARGHAVRVYEPQGGWSRANLLADCGAQALDDFAADFPELESTLYDLETFDLDAALEGVELALVHEWNDPVLVRRLGERRGRLPSLRLLFHDTHHRSVSSRKDLERYDLGGYDGVLAFGETISELYRERGWAARAWTWHEAADVRLFRPLSERPREGDLVWIGNWGDGERSAELDEFLLRPVRALRLTGSVFGVRYPVDARIAVAAAGLSYRGRLPNARAPELFARHRVTVHVPRRPYAEALPGIPTIRVFEALAAGIPLVSAPWDDVERLFAPGRDYLLARDGGEMQRHLADVLRDHELATELARHGRETILARHTCGHRVDELLAIASELRLHPAEAAAA